MKIEVGKLYHIKDDFFKIIGDESLMTNHENGRTRPTYLAIKENDILWFIPLSTKVKKYNEIIDHKNRKYGYCYGILIDEIANRQVAILLQNAFPTLEKYIDHEHTIDGNPIIIFPKLKERILKNFKMMLKLKRRARTYSSQI